MNARQAIDVLYEDDYLIAVNKPANILSLPDSFVAGAANVKTALESKQGKLFVNHRLDKETSGVLLYSKSAEAHQAINQLWQSRKVHKTYWALVDGRTPEKGKINVPILALNDGRKAKVHEKQGKEALTEFVTKEVMGLFSLVELRILTGRLHQIRVHMKHLGHPLMIDNSYGQRSAFFLSDYKSKYRRKTFEEERPLMDRLSLHAISLAFKHPFSGEEISIKAPLPKDFKALINQLRKLSA